MDASLEPENGARLSALVRASQEVAAEPHPARALWNLIERLRADLGVDRAGVFALNRETQSFDRITGVDRRGCPEFAGQSFALAGAPHPLRLVGTREIPHYFSNAVREEYPDVGWAPGMTSHAITPIITGDVLLGVLCVDNCLTGRPFAETLPQALFLYAGLAALPLLGLQRQHQREGVDALRRGILADLLLAVSGGKVRLCGREEIDAEWPGPEADGFHIRDARQIAEWRRRVRGVCEAAGMTEERAADFELCASEAASNALFHAQGGVAAVVEGNGAVRIRVTDEGAGIDPSFLPSATLLPGASTRASAGLGYTLIKELADRVFLYTGPQGTTIVLEKRVAEEAAPAAGWPGECAPPGPQP